MLVLSINKKREFKYFLRILVKTVWAAGLMAILTSCGTSPGYNYTISGTVSGMIGSGLVLQDNGGDDRTVTANGAFAFATALNHRNYLLRHGKNTADQPFPNLRRQ